MNVAATRGKAWDEAVLLLLYERGPLDGESLLAAIVDEAGDALARLSESGMVGRDQTAADDG